MILVARSITLPEKVRKIVERIKKQLEEMGTHLEPYHRGANYHPLRWAAGGGVMVSLDATEVTALVGIGIVKRTLE